MYRTNTRKSNTKTRVNRRVPTVVETGGLAAQLVATLQDERGDTALFQSTEFCKNRFVGCRNPNCTYAHSEPAARWTPQYADEMANKPRYYTRPSDASAVGVGSIQSKPISNAASYPRFIVRLDDDDDDDAVLPSMSLTQMEQIEKRWLDRREQLGHQQWVDRVMRTAPQRRTPLPKTLLTKMRHVNRVRPGSVQFLEDMEFENDMDLE